MSNVKARPRRQSVARILGTTPAQPPHFDQPYLIVAVGLPGSGKSTFCRKLAAATGAVVLESDAVRTLLFPQPVHSPEESQKLFAALYEAARVLLLRGASVIIDATNLRERHREPAYEVARLAKARIVLLHFSAPEDIIAARLARREARLDPEDCSTADMAVYRQMESTEQALLREHVRIDTSDPVSTAAALAVIAASIKSGQLKTT